MTGMASSSEEQMGLQDLPLPPTPGRRSGPLRITDRATPSSRRLWEDYLSSLSQGREITHALMPPTPIDSLPTGPGATETGSLSTKD